MNDRSSPQAAKSSRDAQGQQNEYRDGDGVGVQKSSTASRQGYRDIPVVYVMISSIVLVAVAFAVIYFVM